MKIKRMLSRNNCGGLVLPLVATIVVFIFLIGIAVLKVGFGGRYIAAMTSTQIAARSAADAGLTLALHEMNNTLWSDSALPSAGDVPLPNSRAYYSYSVAPNTVGGYTITSTGKRDGETRYVFAMTSRTLLWSYAIAVDGSLTFKPKTTIDTYPDAAGEVDIRTNSTVPGAVWLGPDTHIPGDIVVGPGGADDVVQVKASSEIDGQVYAADSTIDFPPVTVPADLLSMPLEDPCETGPWRITEGPHRYRYIDRKQGGTLTISGGVVSIYVEGTMQLGNGAKLEIENGSLLLYLGGDFTADNTSDIINATGEASRLRMYGTATCSKIVLRNSVAFYGAVYAPNADLYIHNSAASYGSFIGKTFEMKNSGEFYYDTRLGEMDPTSEPSFFQVQRWWER